MDSNDLLDSVISLLLFNTFLAQLKPSHLVYQEIPRACSLNPDVCLGFSYSHPWLGLSLRLMEISAAHFPSLSSNSMNCQAVLVVCLPWYVAQGDGGVLIWKPVHHLKVGCDSFQWSLIREWFGQEWNSRLSWRGSCQEIQGVESGVSWCQIHILKVVSTCHLFSEFQPCDSPPAPSSKDGACQRVSDGRLWQDLLCFVPQTPTSAASTTEAVSRSAWTQRAATNASATLHTSSTGIKKTVWVRGTVAQTASGLPPASCTPSAADCPSPEQFSPQL